MTGNLTRAFIAGAITAACAATSIMCGIIIVEAVTHPTRTFTAALIVAAGAAYVVGRTRPFLRLYLRADDAHDRALHRWVPGQRVWPVAVGYAALHPWRFTVSLRRVRRQARTGRKRAAS